MRRTLIVLLSAVILSIECLSLRSLPSSQSDQDACATVDCASGLICALAIPQSCNVSPCPKMPTCLPQNQTCSTNSCSADETCVLRSVTCIKAPCYPVRECAKYPKCGVNEEYNECSLSSPCEPNCNDSFPICANNECGKGACECKAGFFRHNGTCIAKDQCPEPTCEKPNEVWSTCPSACTRTCRIARGKDEEMMCDAMCGSPQCTCAVGYVRDDDWNCVKEDDCPKEFKCDSPHEEYKECSSHCEPTCENRSPTCIESCGPAKCQCKPSYVRHAGHCLFALQCPLEGNPSITPLRPDRSGSEESEENSNENDGPSCASVRCGENTTCSIKGGKPICAKCGKNERIESCPNLCSESSCDSDNSGRRCMVNKMCQPQRCICSDGYVRNMMNGDCIKKNKCPTGDNSTMHIQPIFMNGTNPLTRPFFPLIDPINENGTMHIMPVFSNWTRPLIRPMFPPMDNETMHIMPHFGNGSIHGRPQVRPMFPDGNGTFHTMPYPSNDMHILPFLPENNGSSQAIPAHENGTMHIMPVFSNWTKPLTRPMFPPMNNETMHIMPHFENGTIHGRPQVRPMFPDYNGTFHTMPFVENGTMHIMPHFENGTKHPRPQILPIFTGSRPQVRPMFPDNNGSFHTMPVNENGTMLIRPFFPLKNGTKLTQPIENGTMNILPFIPSHNESGNGAIHILPYIPSNASNHNVCANHKCPEGSSCEETPVMCITAPCSPIPTCVTISPRGGGARDQPSKCGKNEEFSTCAPRCQPTCRGVNDCIEAMICTAGCVCKDKFKRDGNGVCVPNHKCWKSAQCQENEIWHKCHGCERTCSLSKEMCISQCESGCACDDGFVRGPNGDCIVKSKCPKNNSNSTVA